MANRLIGVKFLLRSQVGAFQCVVVNEDLANSLIQFWSSRTFKLKDKPIVSNVEFPADLPSGAVYNWGIDLSEVIGAHTMPADPILRDLQLIPTPAGGGAGGMVIPAQMRRSGIYG